MAQLLTVSRAARLVGVSRGTLQKKIRKNELETFEGMIQVSDLLRVYPKAQLEDDSSLERVRLIKAQASPSSREQPQLPTPEVLATRLTSLSRELVETRQDLQHYANLVQQLAERLHTLQQQHPSVAVQSLLDWLTTELAQRSQVSPRKTELLVKDTFLRLLSASVKVIPSGKEFFVEGQHSLLEAALNAGLSMNYGCTSGNCGACKARVLSGETLKIREHSYALSASEQNLGYVLMCSYTAVTDTVLEAAEAQSAEDIPAQRINAQLKQRTEIGEDLLIVQVQTPKHQSLRFMAGQSVRLTLHPDSAEAFSAQYPIASCPCDGQHLQFHIRRRANKAFTRTLFAETQVGDPVRLEGPIGICGLCKEESAPLVFVAQGDGFAALKSLIEQAVSADRAESLRLYWIASEPAGHYMNNLCRAWTDALDNFSYLPLLSHAHEPDAAWVAQAIAADHADLSRRQFHVAGGAAFVAHLRELLIQQQLPAAQYFVLENAHEPA